MMSRYRPVGWRGDSYRHYLAAKGVSTRRYNYAKESREEQLRFVENFPERIRIYHGTDERTAKKIAKEGLRRGSTIGAPGREPVVHFATTREYARNHGPAIFTTTVPVDKDAMRQSVLREDVDDLARGDPSLYYSAYGTVPSSYVHLRTDDVQHNYPDTYAVPLKGAMYQDHHDHVIFFRDVPNVRRLPTGSAKFQEEWVRSKGMADVVGDVAGDEAKVAFEKKRFVAPSVLHGFYAKKDDSYSRWRKLVNMSPTELEKFKKSSYGKVAGLSRKEASSMGIHSGRDSAAAIIRMKRKPRSEWTNADEAWMKRQVSFVSRMKGNPGPLYDDKGRPTRKLLALKIWGHNPEKRS